MADHLPWSGGDRLNYSGGFCSSSFGVHDSSNHYYVVTAGHCGTRVFSNGSNTVGSTHTLLLSSGGYDEQSVTVTSSEGFVYSGCGTCTNGVSIVGHDDGVVGEALCFDGSVSLQSCGANITAQNQCVHFTNGDYTCHLTLAVSGTLSCLSQPGDSGGPVYFLDSSTTATAAGIIIGQGADCTKGWEMPISSVLGPLGVTLD